MCVREGASESVEKIDYENKKSKKISKSKFGCK